jgi:hypothetical protein
MYCKHCGIKLDGKRIYCPECGKRIEIDDKENGSYFYHKPKHKLVAGLLAILFGFGIYSLYLKNIKKGMIQLLVPTASILLLGIMTLICNSISNIKIIIFGFFVPLFLTGVLIAVMHLWCIIEGFLILSGLIDEDGHGNKLL